MKKNIANFILTIVLAVILSLFLPWWSIMVAGCIASLTIELRKVAVFLIPFLAILCFWSVYAFILSSSNNFILAKKIAVLLSLSDNPYLLILVTGVLGGVAAGVAGILGKQIKNVIS